MNDLAEANPLTLERLSRVKEHYTRRARASLAREALGGAARASSAGPEGSPRQVTNENSFAADASGSPSPARLGAGSVGQRPVDRPSWSADERRAPAKTVVAPNAGGLDPVPEEGEDTGRAEGQDGQTLL